jgi:hypothetical protein
MSFMSPPVPEPVPAPVDVLWLLVPEAVEPLALIEPIEPMALPVPVLVLGVLGVLELPALLVPPTAPVLDAVAPPVLVPVELLEPLEPDEPMPEPDAPLEPEVWSLPWFIWLLLFRLPEPPVLPRLLSLLSLPMLDPELPTLLPFASLDF